MLIRCPQIPKSAVIEVPVSDKLKSFWDLSCEIVKELGLPSSLKAVLYNNKGQPFIYNLDLMHLPLPKLDFSQEMWVVFTASPSTIDAPVAKFNQPLVNATKVSILRGTDRINIEVDLDHSLDSLRALIF